MRATAWPLLSLLSVIIAAAACAPAAPVPCTTCGDVCVDVQTDSSNCGACGTVCSAGQRCTAGACVLSCPGQQQVCGLTCADTKNDPHNCGGCGTTCEFGQRCESSSCVATCTPGLTDCSGACVATQSDPVHCGDCTTQCTAGQFCAMGSCTSSCPAPLTVCAGNACVDTTSDPGHCGACDHACASGPHMLAAACRAGSCVAPACQPGFSNCNGTLADGCETAGDECTFTLVSPTIDGAPADGGSTSASVDDTGRFVVFTSTAGNLVANDTNGVADVFLRDVELGVTTRLSTAADGGELAEGSPAGAISGDGRFAAFTTTGPAILPDGNGAGTDVIVVDLGTGARSYGMLSSAGAQPSGNTSPFGGPTLSYDGRYVMQSGRMTGLFPGDGLNGQNESDIYVYDRDASEMRMASLTSTGALVTSGANGYNAFATLLSGNGRFVAYNSAGNGIVPGSAACSNAYVVDMRTATPTVMRVGYDNGAAIPCSTPLDKSAAALVNDDGSILFFDTKVDPAVSGSSAGPVYNVFFRAGVTSGASRRVSKSVDGGIPDGDSHPASIDGSGGKLVFTSTATNLVALDSNGAASDCFLFSTAGTVTLLNQPVTHPVALTGTACGAPELSRNGEWAVFHTPDGLVSSDTNGQADVYLRRLR